MVTAALSGLASFARVHRAGVDRCKLKTRVALAALLGFVFVGALPSRLVASQRGEEDNATIDLGHGVTMDFVLIRPGSFVMGSNEEAGDGDESPPHKVTLTEPYYLGKYEVTQEQWESVMGSNPSRFKGARLPVESVSWNDCQHFLAALQQKTGRRFSLPTEAQWEYACRAGTTSRWSFGDNDSVLGDYAWCGANSGGTTHPVGGKKPNAWGLFDMHGNVGEWTCDWYAKHSYDRGEVTDPHEVQKPDHSPIWRGGAWGDNADYLRSAYRNVNGIDNSHHGLGLRCVMFPATAAPATVNGSPSP